MIRRLIIFLVVSVVSVCAQSKPAPVQVNHLPSQRIGADDLVSISVFDAPEFSLSVRVGRDGEIRMPMLKRRIPAQGLFPNDLEVEIAKALQEEELLNDPYVTVNVLEYMSRPISVAGAVRKPNTFQAVGDLTLLEALTRAEGLTEAAGNEILLTRPSPAADGKGVMMLTQRIPVKGLIDEGRPELNIPLYGGEQIRVPEAGKIFVVGNVKKPGAFRYGNESDMTVLTAIAQAEGLTDFAGKQAYIYRKDDLGTKNEVEISLEKILNRTEPDVSLTPDDVLYIPEDKGARRRSNLSKSMLAAGIAAVGALTWGLVR